jgi:predicted transcriptional regulator of viral defense system
MFRCGKGDISPNSGTEYSLKTADFFNTHPVFSLDEAVKGLAPPGGRTGTLERLNYHQKTGRLKRVSRGIYAVVPPGLSAKSFQPDPFLTAAATRPDGVFSHHSALTLLGVAHSVWSRYTLYTASRRRLLHLGGAEIRFLGPPGPLKPASWQKLGVRRVEYRGKLLSTTGPERTLVEGFRQPDRVGGLAELVDSSCGFATLDFDLIIEVLQQYDAANLWAATGWFLERFERDFHVSEEILELMSSHRPKAPQYMERNNRKGVLAARWNLMLPESLIRMGEPDERQS